MSPEENENELIGKYLDSKLSESDIKKLLDEKSRNSELGTLNTFLLMA